MSESREIIKEFLAGLIGIPMLFDGNVLCPECLHHSMDIAGKMYYCKNCNRRFLATVNIDEYGKRWLLLNDS